MSRYKVGDTVYHYALGQGKIISIKDSLFMPIEAEFNNWSKNFTMSGCEFPDKDVPSLSFKPYDLVNGGFSLERPKEVRAKAYKIESMQDLFKAYVEFCNYADISLDTPLRYIDFDINHGRDIVIQVDANGEISIS